MGFACCLRSNKEHIYWCLEVEINHFEYVLGVSLFIFAI